MFKKFRRKFYSYNSFKTQELFKCSLQSLSICCNLLFIICTYLLQQIQCHACIIVRIYPTTVGKKNPPELDFFSPFLTELLFSLPRDTSHCSFVAHLGQIGALPILPIWNSRRPHVNTVSPSSWRQIAPLLSQLQVSALNVSSLNCGRSN